MNPESLKQAREAAEKAAHNYTQEKCIECEMPHNNYRHRYGCSIPEDVYRKIMTTSFTLQLLDHVDALEKKLEKAREALEFYASIGNWQSSTENFGDPEDRIAITDVSGFIRTGEQLCGGRRARSVLKELES